ncbi:hypothetical protein NBRC116590_29600 [Pelagimonas sp. KU-00592-HH]|jgi:uncharacterized protein YdiU (UPF0061 family)|uniref:hypothetical protein n=1 Tax=Roseobacteraceae TaxID=2854170 RepID=UPI0020CEC307|nr:hypothetical protein [Shimia sp. CNT1-13L.2]MCP9482164.1 hypothetical protein [Shimia sp. CNT1-13L.2]
MAYYDDLANKLALQVIEAERATGDDMLVQDIAKVLQATSSTMHEAFMTAVRVYAANDRARELLAARLKAKGFELAE